MKKALLTMTTLLAVSSFASADIPTPQKCVEQAKDAAKALENIFVAPAYKDQISSATINVRSVKRTVVNQVNRWSLTIAFTLPIEDKYGNKSLLDVDTYNVTLAENTATDCYHVNTQSY
jgi:hypothetical protein